MAELAEVYMAAKKAMIVFNQNLVSVDAARLIADIALLSGHIGTPRDGILQVKAKNNSQGLVDLGITAGAEAMDGIKALVCFGEDPDAKLLKGLEFLAVVDTHMTKTAQAADVVIPGTGFASTDGTFTNTERRLQGVNPAIDEGIELSNWEVAAEIAYVYEEDFGFEDEYDIMDEMVDNIPAYRDAQLGEVLVGVEVPKAPKFAVVEKAKMYDPLKCTDNLMNVMAERLPKPQVMTK